MEICSNCGATTIGENCHRCGSPLSLGQKLRARDSDAVASPTVELISRGHEVVEVEAVEIPIEDLADVPLPPIPPGGVEVTVDDITLITTEEAEDEQVSEETDLREDIGAESDYPDETAEESEATVVESPGESDRWDHLRPHGEMPPLARRVSMTGRIVEILAGITAVASLVAAGIHFYLNTRLEALGRDLIVVENIDEVQAVADASLVVVAGSVVVSLLALLWWRVAIKPERGAAGRTGALTALALICGVAVVGIFYSLRRNSATEAIAANALIILGLGLIVSSFLIVARLVDRLDQEDLSESH